MCIFTYIVANKLANRGTSIGQGRMEQNQGSIYHMEIRNFEEIEFYHVYFHLNIVANKLANRGTSIGQGRMEQNQGSIYHMPLP